MGERLTSSLQPATRGPPRCFGFSLGELSWQPSLFDRRICRLQVCRQLYEVMTRLAEQHSDKVFTIQGAPRSAPRNQAETLALNAGPWLTNGKSLTSSRHVVSVLSDSGPLRLARTPSPPEDESPPESPDASSNHTLRPVSPGPPRPKSPAQVRQILGRESR